MSYPFAIIYGTTGWFFNDEYISGRQISKWYMSDMGLDEMAFGRVITLDESIPGNIFPYMGFVYWNAISNAKYCYVMRLDMNLD